MAFVFSFLAYLHKQEYDTKRRCSSGKCIFNSSQGQSRRTGTPGPPSASGSLGSPALAPGSWAGHRRVPLGGTSTWEDSYFIFFSFLFFTDSALASTCLVFLELGPQDHHWKLFEPNLQFNASHRLN